METERTALLHGLLADWAERHRLAPQDAEAIRRAILATHPGPTVTELPAAWWNTMFQTVAAHVQQSVTLRRYLPKPAPVLLPGWSGQHP